VTYRIEVAMITDQIDTIDRVLDVSLGHRDALVDHAETRVLIERSVIREGAESAGTVAIGRLIRAHRSAKSSTIGTR
jgi:hypothetical protein